MDPPLSQHVWMAAKSSKFGSQITWDSWFRSSEVRKFQVWLTKTSGDFSILRIFGLDPPAHKIHKSSQVRVIYAPSSNFKPLRTETTKISDPTCWFSSLARKLNHRSRGARLLVSTESDSSWTNRGPIFYWNFILHACHNILLTRTCHLSWGHH